MVLIGSKLFGKKWITTVLVRISSPSARTDATSLGATLDSYSTFDVEYFSSWASF